ncbi:MAG: hypothetical protein JSW60_03870 [Thermoplasmatales archaeon]|nr:MAG: hypothetical protein JSW60_03870 [Thermoplasmatales archaeon]
MKKLLVVVVILLLVGMSVPSTGNMASFDDITPPITTCTLDPPEPDGDNGWYVSDVTVTLNATDDMSGVKEIKYKIGTGSWQTIPGDNGSFIIDIDGGNLQIEFYAIDNVGNEESHHTFEIDMDQTSPEISFEWDIYEEGGVIYIRFSIGGFDMTSGMNRVEFFIGDTEYEIVTGGGPTFEFVIVWSPTFRHCVFSFYLYDEAGNQVIVKVESIKVFLFGRIENLTMVRDIFIFNAVRLRVIQFSPISFNTYISGEKIALFVPRLKIVNNRFVFGFFIMLFGKVTISYN